MVVPSTLSSTAASSKMSVSSPPRRYATVYQVFVDRFDPGGPVPPSPERADVEGTERRPFGAAPDQPPRGIDLQGGTLFGVAQRLHHIASLADALYLTPITRAPSNHKYDASDLEAIDDHFGGEAAFAGLLAAMRQAKLDLFLDGVFNHVGERHPWAHDPAHASYLRGTGWRGHANLPEIDLAHPAVRAALIGPDGVVARFIRRGVAGLRLDCANDLGPAFCGEVAAAIARAGGSGGAIGEVMSWPAPFLVAPPAAGPGRAALDGAMNYWLRAAVHAALRDEAQIPVAQRALDRLCAAVPLPQLLRSWTILSSHDTPRLSDQVGFDEARAQLCLALQFAYPGTPLIYYGEELGMTGGADPGCRGAMVWDESRWDQQRLAFVRRLVALRRRLPALVDGTYVSLDAPASLLAFARTTALFADTLICVANPSARAVEASLPLPLPGLYDAMPFADLLGGPPAVSEAGWLRLSLPPRAVRWLMPHDDDPSAYRFWKSPSL